MYILNFVLFIFIRCSRYNCSDIAAPTREVLIFRGEYYLRRLHCPNHGPMNSGCHRSTGTLCAPRTLLCNLVSFGLGRGWIASSTSLRVSSLLAAASHVRLRQVFRAKRICARAARIGAVLNAPVVRRNGKQHS